MDTVFLLKSDIHSFTDPRGATIIATRIENDRWKGSDGQEYLECGEGVFIPMQSSVVTVAPLPVVRIATESSLKAWDQLKLHWNEPTVPLVGVAKPSSNEF